jgi:KaiC/GvpD/RAD55 family RecA-like ATPase
MTNEINYVESINNAIKPLGWFKDNKQELEPYVDGLLYRSETLFLYGAAGSGKSLTTFALAKSLASDGGEFLGRKAAKNLKVLYLDGEMHVNSIGARVELFGADDLSSEQFRYLQATAISGEGEAFDLSDPNWLNPILNFVAQKNIDLVVIDSVRTCFLSVEDENSKSSWDSVQQAVIRLRAAGSTVIVIHHATKDATKEHGVVEFSGHNHALTVFDRAIGIKSEGGNRWGFTNPKKEGRSGDGWGDWVEDSVFEIDAEAKNLMLVRFDDHEKKVLIEFVDRCLDREALPARDHIRWLSKQLGLRLYRGNTYKLWTATEHKWELIEDVIEVNSIGDFKKLMRGELERIDPYFEFENVEAINGSSK